MVATTKALIKPELLAWARKSAGFSIELAAKRAQVKPERLHEWENGEDKPTINQLRKLGEIYKRPLAVFYLPSPPKSFDAVRDFRRTIGGVGASESPELKLEIRNAHHRREIALDIIEASKENPPQFPLSAKHTVNPELIANTARTQIGVSYETQIKWHDDYQAFNFWRRCLENLGILVFQASGVQVEEMRGFSISTKPLPVIVVNNQDSIRGRIFSLMHELGHVIINISGLCDLEEGMRETESYDIEIFCNNFAGAVLVPMNLLLAEKLVVQHGNDMTWLDHTIRAIAKRFNVSNEVILRRLLIADRTTNSFYGAKRAEYKIEYKRSTKKFEGFVPPYVKALSCAGPYYINLVLNSYYNNIINTSELADNIGIRLKHISKIEQTLIRYSP